MNKNKKLYSLMRHWRFVTAAVFIAAASVFMATDPPSIFAASNSNLTQTINAGTLTTDIRDASRASVANPSVAFGAVSFAYTCWSVGGGAPTASFGTNTERIYVDNPGAANDGWVLSLAVTGANTTLWQNGGSTENYDFNDPGGSGCTDGGDADSRPGQLTVDPSVSTLTADCQSCNTSNITKGSSTGYNQGTTDSVTLLNAALASSNVGRWYLTGVGMTQTIPAEQTPDAYTINMTLSIVAN